MQLLQLEFFLIFFFSFSVIGLPEALYIVVFSNGTEFFAQTFLKAIYV